MSAVSATHCSAIESAVVPTFQWSIISTIERPFQYPNISAITHADLAAFAPADYDPFYSAIFSSVCSPIRSAII
jgi:hypothetical protein